jgi:hypothetical protein
MLTGSTRRISLAIFAACVAASTQAQAHSSSCTPAHLTSALKQVEAECGSARVISAHRPGARIRGSGHVSQHALCDGTHGAIDAVFSNRACALNALRKTNYTIITYGKSSHIHIGTDGWRNGTHVARRNTVKARVASRQRASTRYASRQGTRYGSRQTTRMRVAAARRGGQNGWSDASWSDQNWSNASWSGANWSSGAESAYAQRPSGRSASRRRVRVASRQVARADHGWNEAAWSGASNGSRRTARSSQTNWSSDW